MYFWRISCCLQQVWDLKSASPLVPFLILLDVSVKVIGVPYPIATSAASITDSAAISKNMSKGKVCQAHVLTTQIWNHCHNSCCSGYNIPVHNHDTLWRTCTATCIHDNYNNILGRQAWFDKTFFPKFSQIHRKMQLYSCSNLQKKHVPLGYRLQSKLYFARMLLLSLLVPTYSTV